MDEQEFDALFSSRPFGTQDARREVARWVAAGRLPPCSSAGLPTICGVNSSHPSGSPTGYDLADFQDLPAALGVGHQRLNRPAKHLAVSFADAAFGAVVVDTQRPRYGKPASKSSAALSTIWKTAEKFCPHFLFGAVIMVLPPSPLFKPV